MSQIEDAMMELRRRIDELEAENTRLRQDSEWHEKAADQVAELRESNTQLREALKRVEEIAEQHLIGSFGMPAILAAIRESEGGCGQPRPANDFKWLIAHRIEQTVECDKQM